METGVIEEIKDLALAAHGPRQLVGMPERGGLPFAIVPNDCKVEWLEHAMLTPLQKQGVASFKTADSFIAYVLEHKGESSRIFVQETPGGLVATAYLDFHGTAPSWMKHRAELVTQNTVEWLRWIAQDRKPLKQVEFAAFLEENQLAVQDPPGAELLEMIQTIESKKGVIFNSVNRLVNGKTTLIYDEEIKMSGNTGTNKGTVAFPSKLELALAPFKGGSHFKAEARLRYRIAEKTLLFSYELVDVHILLEIAVNQILKGIQEQTGIVPFQGSFRS